MSYHLGGYYLIKPRPISFGSKAEQLVFTASECINDNALGDWAYPWDRPVRKSSAQAEKTFSLGKSEVDTIRVWVGAKVAADLIGWDSVFLDRRTAVEYRDRFFSDLEDVSLLAIYLGEDERAEILNEFKPESETFGEIGLYRMLRGRVQEPEHDGAELLGFDLIGVEDGGDFHTFHCHDMADELCDRFGLTFNQFGLLNEISDWQPVLDYMNDEETGCEPVPWYVVKVKSIDS